MKEKSDRLSSARNNGHVKNVGIWIRVNIVNEVQNQNAKQCERRARRYAEANGWNVREKYCLIGVSGMSVMKHAETQRMLVDVNGRHITGLIFADLSRLSRDRDEIEHIVEFFRKNN